MKGSLLTQLVGSYSKPSWLIRHHRVTTPYGDDTFWRPEPDVLQDAQDDATRLAIADQERAGLDVITDGEERRHRFDSYFLRFHGLDSTRLGQWSMADRDMSFIRLDPALKGRLGPGLRTPRRGQGGLAGTDRPQRSAFSETPHLTSREDDRDRTPDGRRPPGQRVLPR